MTMTLPWRRITLHLSHIGLTLALTFMVFLVVAGLVPERFPGPFLIQQPLLVAVNNPTTSQVVRT